MNVIENRIKVINEQLESIDTEKNKKLFLTEMKKIGIELEWPPTEYAYQCAMGGIQKEKIIQSFESYTLIYK